MSGYPFDPGSSFLRDPARYPHDAFGADTGGRSMPHTGLDVSPKKRGDTTTPVLAPASGEVVRQGFDKEAGNYHIIRADRTGLYWGLGHHYNREVRGGHVERGDRLARMGSSGGAKGVHVHIWVATNLAAAEHIVTGYVNLKRGRSTAQWAQSMGGLLDPYPLILAEWRNEEQRLADIAKYLESIKPKPPAPTPKPIPALTREDKDMVIIRNTDTGNVYSASVQFLRHETDGPAGDRLADLLTSQRKVADLNETRFREVLNGLGIPLSAADATLRGKVWSVATGVVDARSIKL